MHRGLRYIPDEVKQLETTLGDQYICNFSVFQSLLDHWALGQLFPIMPIHRLEEKPTHHAVLGDITCDSDGKVDQFIDRRDVKKTLALHDYKGEDVPGWTAGLLQSGVEGGEGICSRTPDTPLMAVLNLRAGPQATTPGIVEYQDDTGAWHTAPSWPPAESGHLYLSCQELIANRSGVSPSQRSFQSLDSDAPAALTSATTAVQESLLSGITS